MFFRRHLKVTWHASLKEEAFRLTEEPKCFYTPTVLLSSCGWGVLLYVDGECVCAFVCGVMGAGTMNSREHDTHI